MGFCPKCGAQTHGEFYCTVCSSETSEQSRGIFYRDDENININENNSFRPVKLDKPPKKLDFRYLLIFSILNLICCCQPLGLASLIILIINKNRDPVARDSGFRIVNILNIVGFVICLIFFVAYMFAVFAFPSSSQ